MMNILFITYAGISLQRDHIRSAAMLEALADSGHQVDVVAASVRMREHPHVNVLADGTGEPHGRRRIRKCARKALRRKRYDAIHAVDDAVLYALRLVRWKKTDLIYDARRRFTGSGATSPAWLWKAFPRHYYRKEARALARASIVYSSCPALTSDLRHLNGKAAIFPLADVPVQSMASFGDVDKAGLLESHERPAGPVVACSLFPGGASLRNVFVSVLKVSVAVPDITFFFQTQAMDEAGGIVENLDISNRCIFLPEDEPEAFFEMLQVADAVVFAPAASGRYVHPQVYSLLQAGVPLVAVQDSAYEGLITDKTAIPVMSDSDSITAGLLRAIREPLSSLVVATAARQRVADHYSYSSFKHRIRMSYRDLLK